MQAQSQMLLLDGVLRAHVAISMSSFAFVTNIVIKWSHIQPLSLQNEDVRPSRGVGMEGTCWKIRRG